MLALVVAVPALWLLMQDQLLNPDFWPTLVTDGEAENVSRVVATVTGFGIAGIAAWDVIDGFLKARRSR